MTSAVIDRAKKVPAAAGSAGHVLINFLPAKKPTRRERFMSKAKKPGMIAISLLAMAGTAKMIFGRNHSNKDSSTK